MIKLSCDQGSDEWKANRNKFCNASEAPAMMGENPKKTRDELLKEKHTGEQQEFDSYTQKILDDGHNVEEKALPFIAAHLGEDLDGIIRPSCIEVIEGMDFQASYDLLTVDETDHAEHKQFNKNLFELVDNGGELTGQHFWQLEHQLLVRDGESCLFVVSDGTPENMATMRYYSRPERRKRLIEGWKLFLEDLDSYSPPKEVEAQNIEVTPFASLPEINVKAVSNVVHSNFTEYKNIAIDLIESINTDPQTPGEFAQVKKAIDFCSDNEDEIKKAMKKLDDEDVAVIKSIGAELVECFRQKRLKLEKIDKKQKEDEKKALFVEFEGKYATYVEELNKTLDLVKLPYKVLDIKDAVKNKRTPETKRAAAEAEYTKARIDIKILAEKLQENEESYLAKTTEAHRHLFHDLQQLIELDKIAFDAVVSQRISAHEQAQAEETKKAELTKKEEPDQMITTPVGQVSLSLVKGKSNLPTETVKAIIGRPSTEDILSVLSDHFEAEKKEVVSWLLDIQESLKETNKAS